MIEINITISYFCCDATIQILSTFESLEVSFQTVISGLSKIKNTFS